jgi:hypothetical protein
LGDAPSVDQLTSMMTHYADDVTKQLIEQLIEHCKNLYLGSKVAADGGLLDNQEINRYLFG